jgi:predicted TIM-barrel fold metal-dependent hydrolase
MLHGLEGSRSLADPYFYPVYEAAQAEDLAICVHTGPGCGPLLEMADYRYMGGFGQNRVLPLVAFHDLLSRHVPERFPSLRFGFIESTASWVPFMLHFLQRETRGVVKTGHGPALFAENRLYVACEADEDLPYLTDHIGPEHIILGSDYGHADQSAELDALATLPSRDGVDDSLAQRILIDNPQRFYGLASRS